MDHWKKALKKFLGEKKYNEINKNFDVLDFMHIKNNDKARRENNWKNQ
jgi:hypothetical protein